VATTTPGRQSARVVDVVDGDTIRVAVDGRTYRLRYIGINAPEMANDYRPAQPFAEQATARNADLVAGRSVWLEKDVSDVDQYGRLLRYVWVGDTMVNLELVRQGYARAGTYPPDVKYQSLLIQAEREARDVGRGLWAD
jgi:micrococcal nuclease